MKGTSIRKGRVTAAVTLAAALAAAAILASCYPGDQLTVSQADVVVTTFDPKTDFATLKTYALLDSVIHLVPEGEKDDISRAYDDAALSTVRSNMNKLGFTDTGDPNTADVLVAVGVTASDYTGYYSYNPCYYYCGWYPYPPGWGWGYPPTIGAYSFRVGTIFVNMALRVNPDPGDEHVHVSWLAALNGISDSKTNGTRIKNGINQAFAQSKYLGNGK